MKSDWRNKINNLVHSYKILKEAFLSTKILPNHLDYQNKEEFFAFELKEIKKKINWNNWRNYSHNSQKKTEFFL